MGWRGCCLRGSRAGAVDQEAILGIAPPAGEQCPADWNDDDTVNSSDVSAFLTSWLDSLQNGNLIADFDGNGAVNSSDISAFLTQWLADVTSGAC